jgi:hypothetical protein
MIPCSAAMTCEIQEKHEYYQCESSATGTAHRSLYRYDQKRFMDGNKAAAAHMALIEDDSVAILRKSNAGSQTKTKEMTPLWCASEVKSKFVVRMTFVT